MTDEPLETLIDKRCRDLLTLASDPKDLTAAIKVAVEWYTLRNAPKDEFGTALRKVG